MLGIGNSCAHPQNKSFEGGRYGVLQLVWSADTGWGNDLPSLQPFSGSGHRNYAGDRRRTD